jgi:GTP-binding protein
MEIRNIAIIAHVDHGKTTLTDAIMRQTGMVSDESLSMDNNALEQERGITIYAKNASFFYKDTKVNIVDTPGHADFGSEVERVLRSIDSVVLIVDAQEGPMPQTRFVLKKSLELGHRPIVVLNKIDKPAARPQEVHDMVLELFMELDATDEQLEFPMLYAIGKDGIAMKEIGDGSADLTPLLDLILDHVTPAPQDTAATARMQPFNLGYDNYVGRMGVGRMYDGTLKKGQTVYVRNNEGEERKATLTKLFSFEGFERKEVEQVEAGDIVMIAGVSDIFIGETVSDKEGTEPLEPITIDEPTVGVTLMVNDSPFAGRSGKFVTNRQIKERLEKEIEVNVGLQIDFSETDRYQIFGRGELHIAVLLETMRREGYEVQVSQPQVLVKEIDGQRQEPFEEVTVDVPDSFSGTVIEKLSKRKGNMTHMETKEGYTRMLFEIPTRGLLGYRGEFIVDTRGEGIMGTRVIGYREHVGNIEKRDVGSMVSMATGKALGFSLNNLQDRGRLYISPNIDIYEGMVIGDAAKGQDLIVNPTKGKKLTNMRASGSDDSINLTPPLEITIERGLELMSEDEYLEITPDAIRLRKQQLKESDRKKKK